MAGYLFTLDSFESLEFCLQQGVYATKVPSKTNRNGIACWGRPQEGTFADYCTMKPGDNVYFFINRKIYGIGEMVLLNDLDCKFSNYPAACDPSSPTYENIQPLALLDAGPADTINLRWVCIFKPSPYFFKNGIDMDELLATNPDEFKMVRALWKLSFIKFTDRENAAFKDAILKYNEKALLDTLSSRLVYDNNSEANHARISRIVNRDYLLKIAPLFDYCSEEDGTIRHEMALEAGLLYQLSNYDIETINVFGMWDYLSHQVIASPFKAIDYMDKMDIYGYRYIQGHSPIISKYLVCELKNGEITNDFVDQTMKYVDWIKQEYSKGDYSAIEAFLVGHSVPDSVREYGREYAKRQYTIGNRPPKSGIWCDLRLVEYRYDQHEKRISFRRIDN